MSNRDWLIKAFPKNATCAEIGVWQGGFSNRILTETNPTNLYLIDPWVWSQGSLPKNFFIANTRIAKNQRDMNEIHSAVIKRFAENTNVHILRLKSHEAAPTFQDGFFDWIYIDGAHDYDNVKRDLESYKNKVKVGGYITGDDYNWGVGHPVQKAIATFLKENTNFEMEKVYKGQFMIKKNK